MKVVQITGERGCELVEVADPKAKGEFVVVKIHVSPMCTEWKGYVGGKMHHPLGHEAAGEVVEVAQEGSVKVGDRVIVMPQYPCGKCSYCLRGDYIYCLKGHNMVEVAGSEWGIDTYAQLMLKQDSLLIPIPDGMSYDHASMGCCGLGPSFGGLQRTGVDRFDTVVITGMGPVGLGGVINAIYRGARVIAVESNPYRANLAKELGANHVVNPEDVDAVEQVYALTNGKGADKAIDCSGVGAAALFCLRAVRRRGEVAWVGASGDITLNGWGDVISKGITLHGSWHWNLGDFPLIMDTIKNSGPLIDKLITHSFPLSQVKDAWEQQITGKCGKVLLYPWR